VTLWDQITDAQRERLMPYYDTIEEDLVRAKAILETGRPTDEDIAELPEPLREMAKATGHIFGADNYAAYKLLESFVEAIEAVGTSVCALAVRHERLRAARPIQPPGTITCPLCDWSARNEVPDDAEARARIEDHLRRAFADHVARAHERSQ
jgi:hypothetical protein